MHNCAAHSLALLFPLWERAGVIGVNLRLTIACDLAMHERFSRPLYLVLGFGSDQRVGADRRNGTPIQGFSPRPGDKERKRPPAACPCLRKRQFAAWK